MVVLGSCNGSPTHTSFLRPFKAHMIIDSTSQHWHASSNTMAENEQSLITDRAAQETVLNTNRARSTRKWSSDRRFFLAFASISPAFFNSRSTTARLFTTVGVSLHSARRRNDVCKFWSCNGEARGGFLPRSPGISSPTCNTRVAHAWLML